MFLLKEHQDCDVLNFAANVQKEKGRRGISGKRHARIAGWLAYTRILLM
jgi:hypothetical protein